MWAFNPRISFRLTLLHTHLVKVLPIELKPQNNHTTPPNV
jgi:hypothetical protein